MIASGRDAGPISNRPDTLTWEPVIRVGGGRRKIPFSSGVKDGSAQRNAVRGVRENAPFWLMHGKSVAYTAHPEIVTIYISMIKY